MSDENSQQIIIKKSKKKGGGHHGGAWKVAYADFVTAMMALFIVLWILAQSEEVKEKISEYFKDPSGFVLGNGPSVMEGKKVNSIQPDIMESVLTRQREMEELEEMGKDIVEQLTNEEEFKNIVNQIEINITDEGLLIEIMESQEDTFFDIGTATLKEKSEDLLVTIGKQLSQINNRIVLEGHTDARQFPGNGMGYTNYELSADRANAARRALLKGGLESSQIEEIRGYADNRLRDPKDPFSASNRRISIIVRFSSIDA
ncbi:MAG: chemotaxis protein MotB [Ignavibacteria bacterium GWB2_35_6b]|nr:MAG: chemotaxis protein MotB [Ignavibacteria bacterium GWB2_35_6b]